jgi:predicted nucleotide-binding protein
MRAKMFIASSVEGRAVADAVQTLLERDADSTIWYQGFFELFKSTLEELIGSLDKWDFGVFVFSADDILKLRDQTYYAVRDNVLLELGLFIGRLGKSRALIIRPRDPDLRIPSDLIGLTSATYDASRGELEAALGPACTQIRKHITKPLCHAPVCTLTTNSNAE